MKIQLKRSNVLDNGVAKEPTAGQMKYGEFAVNYNADDPAIFLKDSNDNIVRIAGSRSKGGLVDGRLGLTSNTVNGEIILDVDLAGGDDGLEFVNEQLKASTASETVFGSVKIGADLNVSNGVISGRKPVIIQPTKPEPSDFSEGYIWFDSTNAKAYIGYIDPSGDKYYVNLAKDGQDGSPADVKGGDGIKTILGAEDVTVSVDLDPGEANALEILNGKLSTGYPVIVSPTQPDFKAGYLWFDSTHANAYVGYKDPSDDEYWINISKPGPPGPASTPENSFYTYPSGVEQTVQARLEQRVSVKDFGAKGDDATDDTAAIQAAIDYIEAANGGIVYFPAGIYRVSASGTTPIYNGQGDLTLNTSPNTGDSQAYCLKISKNNVTIEGEGANSVLQGSWTYEASEVVPPTGLEPADLLTEPWGIMYVKTEGDLNQCCIKNILFKQFSFGFGTVNSRIIQSNFSDILFASVGIGCYIRHQERNKFNRLDSMSSMSLVVAGGMCAATGTRSAPVDPTTIIDEGGLTDKCTFDNLNLSALSGVKSGGSHKQFDDWFDTYCARWDLVTASSISSNAPNARYPHQGITGRVLYIMSRYSRPNNSNRLGQISGAKILRAVVQVEAANSWNNDGVVYGETVGYTNDPDRDQGVVGTVYQDSFLPRVKIDGSFLPADSETPYAVKGIGTVLDLQRAHVLYETNQYNSPLLPRKSQATVANPQAEVEQESTRVKGTLAVEDTLDVTGDTTLSSNKLFTSRGGRLEYLTSPVVETVTTDIKINGGNSGKAGLVLVSRGQATGDAYSAVYAFSLTAASDSVSPTYTLLTSTGAGSAGPGDGTGWVTFGQTADAEPLITVNGGTKNCIFTFIF